MGWFGLQCVLVNQCWVFVIKCKFKCLLGASRTLRSFRPPPQWVSHPEFAKGLCVCSRAQLQCFNSLQLCFSFYFVSAEPQSCRRWAWGPSQVCPGHANSPAHVHCLLEHQEYKRAFQRPHWHLIPKIFFLTFLAHFLFAPTGITATGSCHVKQLLLIVFSRHPRIGFTTDWSEPGQISFQTVQIVAILWGYGFEGGGSKPVLPPPMTISMLVLKLPCRLGRG